MCAAKDVAAGLTIVRITLVVAEVRQRLSVRKWEMHKFDVETIDLNTLATGYGDFRTSVASGRRRATEISVFAYGWLEEGFGLCCVLAFVVIQP